MSFLRGRRWVKRARDPQTAQEWRLVVDGAAFVLVLDSAQQFGLIEGAPSINPERCVELLTRGEALGYEPAPLEELARKFVR